MLFILIKMSNEDNENGNKVIFLGESNVGMGPIPKTLMAKK